MANVERMQRRRTYRAPIWSADYFTIRHIAKFVRPQLAALVTQRTTVLDAGCGEQPLRAELKALGATYVSLDVVQNRTGTVDVVAPLWKVPLEAASFDVIVATEVLEHVEDVDGAFAELARLLRPGGSIVITTPFSYPLHELPHDFIRLTTGGLERLAQRHGLRADARALGDELDVLASTFGNLLANIVAPLPFPVRAAAAVIRLPVNVGVNLACAALSAMLGPVLPRRSYLTTAAVLTR